MFRTNITDMMVAVANTYPPGRFRGGAEGYMDSTFEVVRGRLVARWRNCSDDKCCFGRASRSKIVMAESVVRWIGDLTKLCQVLGGNERILNYSNVVNNIILRWQIYSAGVSSRLLQYSSHTNDHFTVRSKSRSVVIGIQRMVALDGVASNVHWAAESMLLLAGFHSSKLHRSSVE